MSVIGALFGIRSEPWMAEGLCQYRDADLFFCHSSDVDTADAARRVCRKCPVVDACLQYALEHHETWGIWGGLSPRQRRALTRPHSPVGVPAGCGTYNGYQGHLRRAEATCQPCKDAMAAYNRAKRARLKAVPPPLIPASLPNCGTEDGARTHARRGEPVCEDCRRARKRAHRRRKLSVVS